MTGTGERAKRYSVELLPSEQDAEVAIECAKFVSEGDGAMNKKDRDLIGSQMREILSDELSKPADKIAAARMLRRIANDETNETKPSKDGIKTGVTIDGRPVDLG